MDKEDLVVLVGAGLSIRGISAKLGKSCGSIRYWLHKYGLKTSPIRGEFKEDHVCSLCGKIATNGGQFCRSCQTKIRRHRLKAAAVSLLGGKCSLCGWNKNISGFEFHHIRGDKEYEIGDIMCKSWASVKKELEKCVLLCSCCHRGVHSDHRPEFMLAVSKYSGKGFN